MKESYGEGLATHTDPESCGASCEGGVEALTGARAGRVLSRETHFWDADAVPRRKTTSEASLPRDAAESYAVEDPVHVRNLFAREPGGLPFARSSIATGRVEKAMSPKSTMHERQKSDRFVVCARQRIGQEGSSPSDARMRSIVSKSGGNSSLVEVRARYGEA